MSLSFIIETNNSLLTYNTSLTANINKRNNHLIFNNILLSNGFDLFLNHISFYLHLLVTLEKVKK